MEFMITFIFWVNVGIVALFCSAFIVRIVQSYNAKILKDEIDAFKSLEEALTKEVEKEDN